MPNNSTSIYWNKKTGVNNVVVPFMSREIMRDLYTKLKDPKITRDEAVTQIYLSDLCDEEKIIVAVNIGEFKERTKISRWVYLKCIGFAKRLKIYTKHK